jgi:hypothetical protein
MTKDIAKQVIAYLTKAVMMDQDVSCKLRSDDNSKDYGSFFSNGKNARVSRR